MPSPNTQIKRSPATVEKLQAENDELRLRLQEAEETIAAIRSGAVDALVVEEPDGPRIYTLEGADRPYRLFVEEMQQGALTLRKDGTIVWCNRQLAVLLKTPQERLAGAPLDDFVSPGSRAVYDNLLWQGQRGSGRGQVRLRAGNGLVSAFLTFNALPKDCGGTIGVLVTDLTTQVHHEQLTITHAALRESERRFREMIDALPVAIFTTDAHGRLTHFNPAAVEFSGRTPELGTDQWCVSFKLYHPDGQPMRHDECPLAMALKEGRLLCGVDAIAERPDGQRRWFTPFPTPLRDGAGKIVGGINMLLDITDRKQAEAELQRTSEFDRTVMNNMAEGLYTVDGEGLVTYMNPAAERLFGWSFEELRAHKMHDMTHHHHPDGTPFPAEECAGFQVLKEGKTLTGHEDVFIRKDGTFFPVVYSSSPIRQGDKIGGLVVVFRDVTERKRAEETHARLAAIVASSDDAIIGKTLDGIITSWNAGAERLLGYRAEEIIGQPITTIIPPERQSEETEILERLRRGERVEHFETVRLAKDGRRIDLSLSISPIRDVAGRVIGAAKIARDITERKQSEQQQQRLFTLVEAINQAQAIPQICEAALDAICQCTNADRAAILFYDEDGVMRFKAWRQLSDDYRAAVEGHSPWKPDTTDPQPVFIEDAARIEGDLRAAAEREGIGALGFIPLTCEGRLVGKFMVYYNQPRQFLQAELLPAQTIASQVAFGVQRQRGAEELGRLVRNRTAELTTTNKQLEAFAYSIAHDLRSPLRSMEGYSALLLEEAGVALSDASKDFARRINRSAQFMDALLQDLLAFSRISQQQIELTRVNLEAVLQEALSRLQGEIKEKNARVDLVGPWPAVCAHEPTLSQVVFNLIDNALKFVTPGVTPEVRVRVQEWTAAAPLPGGEGERWSGSGVRLWVEDNGIGIAPEHQGQVFQLFVRLHRDAYAGTGVGLAIVQKGIERMGGRVGVESTSGRGSQFWFELRKG